VAFVLPRFGERVVGGAETLGRGLAQQAQQQGWAVEVWSSCATDYGTWQNVLPAGTAVEDGLLVRRFMVDPWDADRFHALNRRFDRQRVLPVDQQYDWLAFGPHSSALVEYVARHAAAYDAVIAMPYLHSITYDAMWAAGERVVLWPCLHDERFAFMEPFRVLLESVGGVVFISPEEADLALKGLKLNIERSAVIGSGVHLHTLPGEDLSPEVDRLPFLLYVGRLDGGKNVPLLYEYVTRYVEEGGAVQLVVAGAGPSEPPDAEAFDYRGQVSEGEKARLLANALALCQPSFNESFSLVMMESWLAGRPALVWSGCAVTRGHVQRSKGGLWFDSYETFKAAVDWLLAYPQEAAKMGQNGRDYVVANYAWPDVVARFARTLALWEKEWQS
jgi:glycosyltransferase involved in cell wall biosynthesis